MTDAGGITPRRGLQTDRAKALDWQRRSAIRYAACLGSGGGWDDSDPGWDRAPTAYYYPCSECGGSHDDQRAPRPWYDGLWEPWWSIARWFAERRKR